MNSAFVNGFLVVRREAGVGAYSGIDRDAWSDLYDLYYADVLKDDCLEAFNQFETDDANKWGFMTTASDKAIAQRLANCCSAVDKDFEVIAVNSEYLTHFPSRDPWREDGLQSLGYDVICIGEWSLLRVLLEYWKGEVPDDLRASFGPHGLLLETTKKNAIVELYLSLAERELVEDIGGENRRDFIEAIEVLRIRAAE